MPVTTFVKDRGEQAFRRFTDDFLTDAEILPLFGGRPLQGGNIDALTAAKTKGGRGGVSLCIEGDPAGRSEFLDDLILLPFGDLSDGQ